MVWYASLKHFEGMTLTLTIEPREARGKKLDALRAEGKMPAVLYGPKEKEPVAIAVERQAFEKMLHEAGESSVITLEGLDKPKDVLIHDVSFDARRGGVIHADFYAIEADKEVTVEVPLEFVGEAPAIKLGGVLTKVLQVVEVTAKPADLPKEIEVDISSLDTLEKQIHVSDLTIPKSITIENEPDAVVALVQEVEEEPEEEPEAIDMDAVEVEKKGKAEEEGETADE